MMWPPRLLTSCSALYESMPEASALRPVQTCTGRFGAAGLSPEGAAALLGAARRGGMWPSRGLGFTLLELMVVIAIIAFASAGVSFALRDSADTALERDGQRLAALLESGRAQSRASGVPVVWRATPDGFRFDGVAAQALPTQWLHNTTSARASNAAQSVVLGPEPLIGPQAIVLRSSEQPGISLTLSTDGLRPFALAAPGANSAPP